MSQKEYDYLVVGAGLFGSVFAYEATKRGKKCLVIDKRDHVGGNCYTENVSGINVHKYGAHIFRTDSKEIWDYVNQFAEFNRFTNCPIAKYHNELYNLPFNMNTFYQLWGVKTPAEAQEKIEQQRIKCKNPKNLEEAVLNLVGTDVYEKLIKGYTEKQWGKPCTELEPNIISRIPIRMTFDNNYFYDRFQGVPIGGYTFIFDTLLKGSQVELRADFFADRKKYESLADKIVFTGQIDKLCDYFFGELPHRSLEFKECLITVENFQGNAVVNYTDSATKQTRSIEHKHFEFPEASYTPYTVVTYEFPKEYKEGDIPFYPVKTKDTESRYNCYKGWVDHVYPNKNVIIGGSVAEYQDYTMAETIESALKAVEKEFDGQ